jgi:hypothetical protein
VPDFFKAYEPEIGIPIARDLDKSKGPFDATAIEAATEAVLPAIELVGSHFTPWTEAGAPNSISDNAAFAHWITGESIRDWSGQDPLDAPINLHIDGVLRGTGKGRNVDDGAFGTAAWLANALAEAGKSVRAGELYHHRYCDAPGRGRERPACRCEFRPPRPGRGADGPAVTRNVFLCSIPRTRVSSAVLPRDERS